MTTDEPGLTRRAFVTSSLGLAANLLSGCAAGEPIEPEDPILAGTCSSPPADGSCTLTNPDIEGPYYLPDVPQRSDLDTAGDDGIPLSLSGIVRDAAGCVTLAGAVVEIWHANPDGEYDNTETANYRGWVESDAEGRYSFQTLVPGRYLNGDMFRPSHIHMKVWLEGTERLTTQIYFADDPNLETDAWAEPERTVCLEESGPGVAAVFDVNLELG